MPTGPVEVPPQGPYPITFPTDYTTVAPINTDDVVTASQGSITVSGNSDAVGEQVVAFLVPYEEANGKPVAGTTSDAVSSAVAVTDLGEQDADGKEIGSYSATLSTAGLAQGLYVVETDVVFDYQGTSYYEDGGVDGKRIISIAPSDPKTTTLQLAGTAPQLSTDGRYLVYTAISEYNEPEQTGDVYERDLQTGAEVDLTALGENPTGTFATNHTTTPVAGSTAVPTFTSTDGTKTFSSIPDFDDNLDSGSPNPLPTVTANGVTSVVGGIGTAKFLVGAAVAASDNGDVVLSDEPDAVLYHARGSPYDENPDPEVYVSYLDPAPTLTIDPVNGTDAFGDFAGADAVTLTGTSDAIGRSVEIDLGAAGEEAGTATVVADGKNDGGGVWSFTFDPQKADPSAGNLFIEASVSNAAGTPAHVSETAIPVTTPPVVTQVYTSTAGAADGGSGTTIGAGDTLTISLEVSSLLTVTGTPTLTLSNGSVATYSGTQQFGGYPFGPVFDVLNFTYTPSLSDKAGALSVEGLVLNGGSIVDDSDGDALELSNPSYAMPPSYDLGVTLQLAPVIQSIGPGAGQLASGAFLVSTATPFVYGTAEAGDTVTLMDGGTVVGSETLPAYGPILSSFDIEVDAATPLAEGSNALTAIVSDGTNSATAKPVTVIVETTPPAETISALSVAGASGASDDISLADQKAGTITLSGTLSAPLGTDPASGVADTLSVVLPSGQTLQVDPADVTGTSFVVDLSGYVDQFGVDGTIAASVENDVGIGSATDSQTLVAGAVRTITPISATPDSRASSYVTEPSLSENGQWVAFQSGPAITSGIYVENIATGALLNDPDTSAPGPVATDGVAPSLSSDGRTLAYEQDDANGYQQVYVKNLASDATFLVSQQFGSGNTVGGNNGSFDRPSLSADGQTVAFSDYATDLVDDAALAGGQTSGEQIFVGTFANGVYQVVVASAADPSTDQNDPTPDEGDGTSSAPSLAAGGGSVAFVSTSDNLLAPGDVHAANVPSAGAGIGEIYVKTLTGPDAGAVTLVSGTDDGTVGDQSSTAPSISSDGRFVVFASTADNLVPGVTVPPYVQEIYLKDLQTGAVTLVSANPDGTAGDSYSSAPVISADGHTVVFASSSDNLVDGVSGQQIYAWDRLTGEVSVLSQPGYFAGNSSSQDPTVSGDGGAVAFDSYASNLVPRQGAYSPYGNYLQGYVVGLATAPDLTITSKGVTNTLATVVTGTIDAEDAARPITVTASDGATATATVTTTSDPDVDAFSATLTFKAEGKESVTATATNAAGAVGSASEAYDVDTQAPVLKASSQTIEATSPSGANVTFGATVSDNIDGTSDPITYVLDLPGSGTLLALPGSYGVGDYTFTASATDQAGNTGSATFTIDVVDTTPPKVTAPNEEVDVRFPSGGVVAFVATASDLVDGSSDPITYTELLPGGGAKSVKSGETFAPGTYEIRASATDRAGNTGSATFALDVAYAGAPVVTLAVPTPVIIDDAVTLSGTIDAPDAGATIIIADNGSVVGSTLSQSDGTWTFKGALPSAATHDLTALAVNPYGTGTSPAVGTLGFTFPTASTPFAAALAATIDAADPSTVDQILDAGTNHATFTVPSGQSEVVDHAAGATTVFASTAQDILAGSGGTLLSITGADPSPRLQRIAFAGGSNTVVFNGGFDAEIEGGATTAFLAGNGVVTSNGGLTAVFDAAQAATVTLKGSDNLAFLGSQPTTLTDLGSSDTIVGGTGAATVFGAPGGSLVFQFAGAMDFVSGGGADSVVAGTGGSFQAFGAAGADLALFGGSATAGVVTATAGAGSETIDASKVAGNTALTAGSGDDLLSASATGRGLITAGTGNGTFFGSTSAPDVFAFANGAAGGTDLIENWNSGDALALSGYDASAEKAALAAGHSITYGGEPAYQITLPDQTEITIIGLTTAPRILSAVAVPVLTIGTPAPVIIDNAVTITGTIDADDANDSISIIDNGKVVGTTTAADGTWSFTGSLPSAATHALAAAASNPVGTGTSPTISRLGFTFPAATTAFAQSIASAVDAADPSLVDTILTTGVDTVPSGQTEVVDHAAGAVTLTATAGQNVIAGSGGLSLFVTGNSPNASVPQKIALAGGTDTIIFASTGYNADVEGGTKTVVLTGSGTLTSNSGGTVVIGGTTTPTVTLNGSNNLVFLPPSVSTVLTDNGVDDVVVGVVSTGAATIHGGPGGLYYLGSGSTTFAGSATGADTVLAGTSSGSATIFGGQSTALFQGTDTAQIEFVSSGGNDSIVAGTAGGIIAFGAAGATLNLYGASTSSANYLVARSGSEVLSATFSTGTAVLIGGSGNDTAYLSDTSADAFFAGTGSATVVGGTSGNAALPDLYAFVNGSSGGNVTILNFGSNSGLVFEGYGAAGDAAIASAEAATPTDANAVSFTLPDNTKITLVGLNGATVNLNNTPNFKSKGVSHGLDGYIKGATVGYLDASAPAGVVRVDPNQPTTTTGPGGQFLLVGGTGPLVLTGGTDTATGLAFAGTLEAPAGSTTLSPLTTLVEMVAAAGGDTSAVDTALGLPASVDLTTYDPEAALLDPTSTPAEIATAKAVFAAGGNLLSTEELIDAAGGSSATALAAVAQQFALGHTVDLTDPATLVDRGGLADPGDVVAIIDQTNAAVAAQLAGTTDPLTIFEELTGGSIALQSNATAILVKDGDTSAAADSYDQRINQLLASNDATAAQNYNQSAVACYCRGTLILTASGEVPVEALAVGTPLVTASGALRPIRWIGTRSYAGRFANANPNVLPIYFKAGSLGEDVPRRDLRVSPKHAMFLDGALIPAEHLVNGVSVIQAECIEVVDYFHIELDSHDVIIAEGALSETFVDDHSRGMFHNAHEFAALFPDAEPVEARYFAPRVEEGFTLEAVRRRLAKRAGLPVASSMGPGILRGFVERIEGGHVFGWAQSAGYPDGPLCLDVLVNGIVVTQVLAERFRPDLLQAGIGDGAHAFEVRLPETLSNPDRYNIAVRRSADEALLPFLMPKEGACQSLVSEAA